MRALRILLAIWMSSGFAPAQEEELAQLRTGENLRDVIVDADDAVHTETLDAGHSSAPTVGKTYVLEVTESGPYSIEMRSHFFDTYLVLRDVEGMLLAEDDDGLLGTHSRLVIELEAGRRYRVQGCALLGARGDFGLAVSQGRPKELEPQERAKAERENAEERLIAVEEKLGDRHPDVATSLNSLGMLLFAQGDYERALPHLEKALALREEILGLEHSDTATSANNLGVLHLDTDDFDTALSLFERALLIFEATLGPEDVGTTTALGNVATALAEKGDYAAAEPFVRRALSIQERVLGAENPATLLSLTNLGRVLERQQKFDEARRLFQRGLEVCERRYGSDHALTLRSMQSLSHSLMAAEDYTSALPLLEREVSIKEETLGPEHPNTLECMDRLGNNLIWLGEQVRNRGNLESAQAHFERALALRKTIFGHEHAEVALAINWLTRIQTDRGDYGAAELTYERVLAIREKALGPEHPDTATSLNSLALNNWYRGQFEVARPLYERALAIQEKVLGAEHADTATTLANLGACLKALNDCDAARPLLERSLAIREKVFGPDHLRTANSLNNLAMVLMAQKDNEGARPLLERALAIREKELGPEHASTILSLNNLAGVLTDLGDYEAARPLYERALAIRERTLGPEHPDTAHSLFDMGRLLYWQEKRDEAIPFYERALAIREKTLGEEHMHTSSALHHLSSALLDAGESDRAWELLKRANLGRKARIRSTLPTLSEAESCLNLAKYFHTLEAQIQMARVTGDFGQMVEAYEQVLDWKGSLGRLLATSREQLEGEASPEQRALVEDLRANQAELSKLALQTEVADRAAHEQRMKSLREERNRFEVELNRSHRVSEEVGEIDLEELMQALPERSAVVDFLVAGHEPYRVLMTWITREDEHVCLDFGEVDDIETAIQAFLEQLVSRRGLAPSGDSEQEDPATVLRELLWDGIAPYLEGIDTVFISPDGVLGTLPFETLLMEDGSYAIERHSFVYLTDVSSLTRRSPEPAQDLDTLLSVGGVDYRKRAQWAPADGIAAEALVKGPGPSTAVRGSFSDYWSKLPATQGEAQTVLDMHEDTFGDESQRLLLQGDDPTEERLKHELGLHSVLHLATHGFFQPAGTESMWEAAHNAQGKSELRMSEEASKLVGKHPGLLSGLVCAGANRAASEQRDDGFLTAEEVGWLDLSDVELVVLSACETGLGRAQSGEGMIGLRRAFRIAGAQTVISSLWSVLDESTAELMHEFYKNLWLKGMGRSEALRQAQLTMLKRNRMERGEGLPSTWGAFVLSGEWR